MAQDETSEETAERLIENERIKLVALFFNTLASGVMLAGIVIPSASILAGTMPGGAPMAPLRLTISAMIWLFAGACLHLYAKRQLGRLKP